MVTEVTRHDVQGLIDQGAQLMDVLETKEYDDSHLPGAVSIPLPKLAERQPAGWSGPSRRSPTATTPCAT